MVLSTYLCNGDCTGHKYDLSSGLIDSTHYWGQYCLCAAAVPPNVNLKEH